MGSNIAVEEMVLRELESAHCRAGAATYIVVIIFLVLEYRLLQKLFNHLIGILYKSRSGRNVPFQLRLPFSFAFSIQFHVLIKPFGVFWNQ